MGERDGAGHRGGVVGDNDQHIDVLADERLHIIHLPAVVAVGIVDSHGAAEFLHGRGEEERYRIASAAP